MLLIYAVTYYIHALLYLVTLGLTTLNESQGKLFSYNIATSLVTVSPLFSLFPGMDCDRLLG